jgi:CHAD domain-containing protein
MDDLPIKEQCKSLQKNLSGFFTEIAVLSETDIVNATHMARKTLKSYRAFVKLLKNCPGVSSYKEANYLLRDLGKEFSDMRDSHVREMLMTELNRSLQSSLLKELIEKNNIEKEVKENVLLSEPNHFEELSRTIKESSVLNELLDQSEIQKSCIDDGIRAAFQKSASAYSECSNLQSEEAFHEWRKRLKDLLNQIKLFRSEEQLLSDERFTNIDELCEEMGMLNDMSMLKEWIEEIGSTRKENSGIISFLEKKIRGFQQRLMAAGDQYYQNPDHTLGDLELMISDE